MPEAEERESEQSHEKPEIVLRNMDEQTVESVIEDITEIGIKREVIRVES